jgi:hypothetical protein
MTKPTFFNSRTAAQTFAKTDGGKFKDQGSASPTGERWSVVPAIVKTEAVESTAKSTATSTAKPVSTSGGFKNKMEHAKSVVAKLIAEDAKRKVIIAELMDVVGLTKNGASTYHQKIKTELLAVS